MQSDNSALIDENSLQPFFVLHKASQSTRRNSAKSKRKIDTLPKGDPEPVDSLESRLGNFRLYWSKVEAIVKDVLRNLNAPEFEKIDSWIRQSFDVISSSMILNPKHVTSSYPLLFPANYCTTSRKIFTGLVCTKNLESVDDILTFVELAQSLKSRGYHVANLTSLDFSQKNGISGCLLNLLQQFITTGIDAADVSALASWYCEQGSNKTPIIVIIDGVERCCDSVLSDFIIMLSEWTIKIPIILMLGVTTTVDALRDILPSCILQHLSLSKFVLEPPSERMDSIIASVLVQYGACFCLGHDVVKFLRNYFLRQDGTLTSFMRALKMASFQHFTVDSSKPGNSKFIWKKDCQDLSSGNIALLQARNIEQVFGLPSHSRRNHVEPDADASLAQVEIQKQYTSWRSLVNCLSEAVKYTKGTLLDVYCEVLDPQLSQSGTPNKQWEHNGGTSSATDCILGQHSHLQKCGSVCQTIRGIRDLRPMELRNLLMKWESFTEGINEVHEKVKDLKKSISSMDVTGLTMPPTDISKRRTTRGIIIGDKNTVNFNQKAAILAGHLMRENMHPVESFPFHGLVCFNNVDKLQSALMGDPRRRIQFDLMESQKFLKCSCCRRGGGESLPSLHDTAIMYCLAQEHGDLINLHNWFKSFKETITQSGTRTKNKQKQSPSTKKRKTSSEPHSISNALIQARFCRAISELQITGLLRMPSKRRPDFVQRVAFGV